MVNPTDVESKMALELWQTEWCPASRRVRERLTELGVDYLIRQVPVEQADREQLQEVVGCRTIPALCLADGRPVVGEQAIRSYLDEHFPEPPEADAHKAKAAKALKRLLEERCA
jgi:glutathione S-transferase